MSSPLLSVRGLTRRFGSRIACRDVGFDLWPGEVLGVVGESGSGKTTTARMIVGLEEPTGGGFRFGRFRAIRRKRLPDRQQRPRP